LINVHASKEQNTNIESMRRPAEGWTAGQYKMSSGNADCW
jgi:hypothetical protein